MKKILTISLTLLSGWTSAQSIKFVGNPWTSENIRSVRNYAISFAGPTYKTVNMQTSISKSIDKAYYLFSDTSGKTLNIDIKRGLINGNSEVGTPADTVIREVKITGFYPLVLKMYSQSFNQEANAARISKNGKAEPIIRPEGKKKISITFYRSNDQSGVWTLWIKLS
jgi:uncharacterized protein YdeI (BOF family)